MRITAHKVWRRNALKPLKICVLGSGRIFDNLRELDRIVRKPFVAVFDVDNFQCHLYVMYKGKQRQLHWSVRYKWHLLLRSEEWKECKRAT